MSQTAGTIQESCQVDDVRQKVAWWKIHNPNRRHTAVRTLEEGRIKRPERAANVVKERLIEEESRTGDAVNSQNVIKIITRIQGE